MKRKSNYSIFIIICVIFAISSMVFLGCSEDESGSANTNYNRWRGITGLKDAVECVGDVWGDQTTSCTIDTTNCIITTTYPNGAMSEQEEDGTITFYTSLGSQCFTYTYTAGTGSILYNIQITALGKIYTITGVSLGAGSVQETITRSDNPGSPTILTIRDTDIQTPNLCLPSDFPGGLGSCTFL